MIIESQPITMKIDNKGAGSGPKMKANVQYFGSIRVSTNINEEEVDISSNATVHELLHVLSNIYGEAFMSEVFQADRINLRDDLMVAINGIFADHLDIMRTELKSDDTIMLCPIFIGGG